MEGPDANPHANWPGGAPPMMMSMDSFWQGFGMDGSTSMGGAGFDDSVDFASWKSFGQPTWGCGAHMRPKRRFCTYYPDVEQCRRGDACLFAHSREELCSPLLDVDEEQQKPSALTGEFFMHKYKTRWCPIGVQHEWHTCVYAHNYQDARRPPSIGYGIRVCPYWSKKDSNAEYFQRCPLGLRCPYSHGAKEQLYHPQYFKTVVCRDVKGKVCPRGTLCAFYHGRADRRSVAADQIDYSQPLPKNALPEDWMNDYLVPPFLPEASRGLMEPLCHRDETFDDGPYNGKGVWGKMIPPPYGSAQMSGSSSYQQGNMSGMPGQCVLLLPVGGMEGGGASGSGVLGSPTPYMMQGFSSDWFSMPSDGQAAAATEAAES